MGCLIHGIFNTWISDFCRLDFPNFTSRFGRDKDSENPRNLRILMVFVSSKSAGKIGKIESAKIELKPGKKSMY